MIVWIGVMGYVCVCLGKYFDFFVVEFDIMCMLNVIVSLF